MKVLEAKKITSSYKKISLISKLHIYIRLRRLPFEIVEKYVPKKGQILDFGCGHGFFSIYLSQKSKARVITGIDIDKEKIENANSSVHGKNVTFKHSNNPIVYLSKRFYNSIVILNVLYLLKREDQEEIIEKAYLSLEKGGTLLIIEPDATLKLRTFYEICRESIMLKLFHLTKGNTLTYNTKNWWMLRLKKQFKEVKCIKLGNRKHHLLYVCTK